MARKAKDARGRHQAARSRAAADLTREPSQRPRSGHCGQARGQPDRRDSVRAIAPCQILRSVLPEVSSAVACICWHLSVNVPGSLFVCFLDKRDDKGDTWDLQFSRRCLMSHDETFVGGTRHLWGNMPGSGGSPSSRPPWPPRRRQSRPPSGGKSTDKSTWAWKDSLANFLLIGIVAAIVSGLVLAYFQHKSDQKLSSDQQQSNQKPST